MSLQQLTLENLHEYDQGSVAVLFDRAMRSIYLDLEDRPRLNKARKVSIELSLKPDDLGEDLLDVIAECKVRVSIPDREARVNKLCSSPKAGSLLFNPDSARAAQSTLPFDVEEPEE